MNRYIVYILLVIGGPGLHQALAQNAVAAAATPEAPVTYAASYQASANGLKASARRSLRQMDNGDYEMVNELQATVLGQEIARLDQRSQFHFTNKDVVTDRYSYRVSGITSDLRTIDFDWEGGTALSVEEDESWTLTLSPQVFDPLSHQFAMSQQLRSDQAIAYSDTYEYSVIDGDKIESHLYQLTGEETLQTPLGKLNTVKLERVRGENSSRSTIIWLAPDWDFLVARIEQTNGSLQMKLELETAEVGGVAVMAMPEPQ